MNKNSKLRLVNYFRASCWMNEKHLLAVIPSLIDTLVIEYEGDSHLNLD